MVNTDDALRQAEIQAREQAATKGPWRWFGNTKHHSLYLATPHSGRRLVMDFVRWGMGGAQPRFQRDGRMVDVKDLVTYEVEYRKDIAAIDHPDADFIAHARQDIPWLLQRLAQVEQETADVRRVSLNHIEQTNALMTWLRAALNGEELNDVALSFALVREVADLKADLAAARQEMGDLEATWREKAEKDHLAATDDLSGGQWTYQHEASGSAIALRSCADDLAAARLRASEDGTRTSDEAR